MRSLLFSAFPVAVLCLAASIADAQIPSTQWDEELYGPLPHWGSNQPPAPDPGRSLWPYSLQACVTGPPSSGPIESIAEYDPAAGLMFRYSTLAWPQVVTDCVVALTADPTQSDVAYVVVADAAVEAAAVAQFTQAGADMSKVEFISAVSDSIWLTDFGPNFIRTNGAFAVVDSHYYMWFRVNDNFVPTLVGEDHFQLPVYHMGMHTSARGNFLVGPNRSAFVSTMAEEYNPDFSTLYIQELYREFLGIDTLHVFPHMPTDVDLTGHIDMWMNLVDGSNVIISQFAPGSDPEAIQITDNAAVYMAGLGYNVFRIPDHNGPHSSGWDAHFTYTNAIRCNDRIFIPSFAGGEPSLAADDAAALAVYQAAAPGCQVIQIPCYEIIWAAGALHCISTNVPKRTDPVPAVQVISPDGGELLASGETYELQWTAADDLGVTGVDLLLSTDGGQTFPTAIASGLANDGREDWTVPALTGVSDQAVLKVVAGDAASNAGQDPSAATFVLTVAPRTVYDFSTGAGVDRWAWTGGVADWSALDGVRHPTSLNRQINSADPSAYAKLAASDATGDDGDPNRYVFPGLQDGRLSAQVFEFLIQEPAGTIRNIEVLWEGYGDNCTQMELYLWDEAAGNWCDAEGGSGENRYLASYAGNRDEELVGHARADFDRFLRADGMLTVLVLTERAGLSSFHDYMAVAVTSGISQTDLGHGGPGDVQLSLCGDDLTLGGSQATLAVSQAAAGAPVFLFAGLSSNPTPLLSGTLVPVPWLFSGVVAVTDPLGAAELPVGGKLGAPLSLYLQAVVPDGPVFEFSNALEMVRGS